LVAIEHRLRTRPDVANSRHSFSEIGAVPRNARLRYGIVRNRMPVVKRLLKKLLLALIVFALPVQGLMAATMPLCGKKAGAMQNHAENQHDHAAHAQAGSHENASAQEHAKDSGQSGVQCHDCASCQVCTSPALTAFVRTMQPAVASSPQPRPTVKILLFFPELFQRPPLALAA